MDIFRTEKVNKRYAAFCYIVKLFSAINLEPTLMEAIYQGQLDLDLIPKMIQTYMYVSDQKYFKSKTALNRV